VKPATIAIEENLRVPLRDGLELTADVYRPAGAGRHPVLVMRLPYDRRFAQNYLYAHPSWYAAKGYAVVAQDVRGRWGSDGRFDPLVNEGLDGADTVAWAAEQPWSNGRVGMYGFSYPGMSQLLVAAEQPPGLRAVVPALAPSQLRDGWIYDGGAFSLAFALGWAIELGVGEARRRSPSLEPDLLAAAANPGRWFGHRPLRDLPLFRELGICDFYFDWIEHETDGAWWAERQVEGRYDRIRVPALHVAGWYDVFVDGSLTNWAGLRDRARVPQRLVVGPWHHLPALVPAGPIPFGKASQRDLDADQLSWFDLWLRDQDDGVTARPPVSAYLTGADRWVELDDWPPADAMPVRWWLHSRGRANTMAGDGTLSNLEPGDEPPDVFVYDPAQPVPSAGGHSCCDPGYAPMGSADQVAVEVLQGVLVYTSAPLTRPLVLAGQVEAELHAVTSAVDTDWVVKLCSVDERGRSLNLQEGIVRARFRDSLDAPEPLVPGEVVTYRVQLGSVFHRFAAGHRVRMQVSSSSFPAWEPNLNTGHALGVDALPDRVISTQQVLHNAEAASFISLPVVEGEL
jgi:putative CocE/NonD family hydrolase